MTALLLEMAIIVIFAVVVILLAIPPLMAVPHHPALRASVLLSPIRILRDSYHKYMDYWITKEFKWQRED